MVCAPVSPNYFKTCFFGKKFLFENASVIKHTTLLMLETKAYILTELFFKCTVFLCIFIKGANNPLNILGEKIDYFLYIFPWAITVI